MGGGRGLWVEKEVDGEGMSCPRLRTLTEAAEPRGGPRNRRQCCAGAADVSPTPCEANRHTAH